MSQEVLNWAATTFFGSVFLRSDSVSRKSIDTEEFVNFNMSKEATMNKIVKFHPEAHERKVKSVLEMLGQVVVSVKRHLDEKASIRDLSKMTDRQLRDIGIERFEIPEAVRGALKKEVSVHEFARETGPVETASKIHRRAA